MKKRTARALESFAVNTGLGPAAVKRGWLQLSHRQKATVLARADKAKGIHAAIRQAIPGTKIFDK